MYLRPYQFLHYLPSVADTQIDCATTSFANAPQVSEPIGSLCMIVGLAPRVPLSIMIAAGFK